MEFDEFTDVSLDNTDTSYYHSFEAETLESEESGIFTKSLRSSEEAREKSVQSLVKPLVSKLYNDVTGFIDSSQSQSSSSSLQSSNSTDSRHGTASAPPIITDPAVSTEHRDESTERLQFDVPNPLKSKHASTARNSVGAIATSVFTDVEAAEQNAVRLRRFGSIDSQPELISNGKNTQCEGHPTLQKQGSRSSIDELLFELYDKHHCEYKSLRLKW